MPNKTYLFQFPPPFPISVFLSLMCCLDAGQKQLEGVKGRRGGDFSGERPAQIRPQIGVHGQTG